MQFRETTLANGLEVVAEVNPQAHASAYGFFVKTGARDENDAIWGVSHYLEHMAFKGTAKRSAADVNRELDELGAHSNAFTSEELTCYYASVLAEYQPSVVELLADMLRPALRQDDFDVEKNVILEEIAKYDDQPPFGAYERCMATHFQKHPLWRSVLGTAASVSALTRDQMLDYFERRYSAGNIVLAAAGKVDFDSLVESANRHCGSWKQFPAPRAAERAAPHKSFDVMCRESSAQEYVVQMSNGPASEDEDRFAARLLATIFGDDSGSRLFWEMVDTGDAEYCAMSAYEYQGTGLLMTYLSCEPQGIEKNLETLERLQKELHASGVTEEELDRAKNKVCAHVILSSERSSNRLFSVGGHWTSRREYRTVAQVVQSYRSVTRSDISKMLERYPLSEASTVCVGPLKSVRGVAIG